MTPLHHHLRRMTGRDPHESHRAATPLELLYDLAIVVAFGATSTNAAHLAAAGAVPQAVVGFLIGMFAVSWAWLNVSWFTSSYDTDDWFVRLALMVQMMGVVVIAKGIPDFFHGLQDHWAIHNQVMVLGYVILRIPMIALWLRASADDPSRRGATLSAAVATAVAQVGWVVLALAHVDARTFFGWGAVVMLLEMGGPLLSDRRFGRTPWHAHHIAERYSLMVIISLGECVIGTTTAFGALVESHGWTLESAVILASGVALTFGLWWFYFALPFGELLAVDRGAGFRFGYVHLPMFAAIAAVGAGFDVAAYYAQGESSLSRVATVAAVAGPTAAFLALVYVVVPLLARDSLRGFHLLLLAGGFAMLALSLVLSALGAPLGWCLLVATLGPWVHVVGFEVLGWRHLEEELARLERR